MLLMMPDETVVQPPPPAVPPLDPEVLPLPAELPLLDPDVVPPPDELRPLDPELPPLLPELPLLLLPELLLLPLDPELLPLLPEPVPPPLDPLPPDAELSELPHASAAAPSVRAETNATIRRESNRVTGLTIIVSSDVWMAGREPALPVYVVAGPRRCSNVGNHGSGNDFPTAASSRHRRAGGEAATTARISNATGRQSGKYE